VVNHLAQPSDLISMYSVRAKLRAFDEEFDWLSSYHSRCFYAKSKPNLTQLESGYLKSTLLVKVCRLSLIFISYLVLSQVYKSIFTSPSSAQNTLDEENNAENIPPTKSQKTSSNNSVRRNVASKLHLNDKVTPRSVAYAAVQVCVYIMVFYVVPCLFWTPTASSISTCKLRVHGLQFMVDLTTRDCITMSSISLRIPLDLLQRNVPKSYSTGGRCECSLFSQRILNDQYDRKIFPAAALHRQPNTSASRKAFKDQRAALEREAA
jgi:hypothetical protein